MILGGSAFSSAAGNPDGHAPVPPAARPVDTSHPDHVVGNGTPASCTSAKVVAAVARAGSSASTAVPSHVTIHMAATAKVFNDQPDVVIDGGGLVTLDGGGERRILYMNTCDPALVWTTRHCQDQAHPTLDGAEHHVRATAAPAVSETMDGGGAIFVRGGRLQVVNARFFGNRCASTGPDVGGAAMQVFEQYHGLPVYVVNSTFGGADDQGNECSNGGAISSIGVSWTIINSLFDEQPRHRHRRQPAQGGTPGGGNGGAIYNDGNTLTLSVAGHEDRAQPRQPRGRQRHLLRQQRPHRHVVIATRSSATTPGTASRPTRASSSSGNSITFAHSTVK